MITIRKSIIQDKPELYKMFMEVVASGEAFMHDETTTYNIWEQFWFGEHIDTYTALEGDVIVASYKLAPNQPGVGKHVANGGYMVSDAHRGKKIGEQIGEHSIEQAKILGYEAMQFNAVVSTNPAAVKLWEKLGFKIVGTNPKAFKHKTQGKVDTHTMYLNLSS